MFAKIVDCDDLTSTSKDKCPHCGQEILYDTEEQMPGFRFPDDLYCPYCGKKIRTSMEVEFYNVRRNDDEN